MNDALMMRNKTDSSVTKNNGRQKHYNEGEDAWGRVISEIHGRFFLNVPPITILTLQIGRKKKLKKIK